MADNREYNILIIEDNPGDYMLVEDFLFEQIVAPVLKHAKSYKAASDIFKVHCNFDVILLDLTLPDKTGEQLIKEIVACSQSVPIIVLTGYADIDFGVRSLSLGISDYILKDELTSTSLYKSIIYSLERQKATLALLESEKRYSDLFHLSPLPMWVVDLNSLRFLDVNMSTINNYGYTRDEFLSMTIKDIRPAEEIDSMEKAIDEDRINPLKTHRQRITVHKMKNGELRNVEVQYTAIMYKGIKANIVISTDITERLAYVKAVEDQNDRLKEISWIQSHIIRAPLTRIMGLIPLITETKDQDEKAQMMEYLILSANELDEVIKEITDKAYRADYQFPDNNTNGK